MSLKLIADDEWVRRYELSDGREISIELDECLEWVKVTDTKGDEIGRIEFSRIENDPPVGDEYKIIWMYMDLFDPSYKRQGIGRTCLKFFNECCGPPTVSEDDGLRRDDGSHLTQDAPAFIHQMQKEGLIAKNQHSSQ